MTTICTHKHTKYQPTDDEWKCPKCGATAEQGFIIYDGVIDRDDVECSLLHAEDFLQCSNCDHETSGKSFAAYIVKKNSLVPCPCCKGTGFVKKGADQNGNE